MPQPGWSQYIEKAEIAACQVLKSIGIIAIWFLNWVQAWAFNGLIAVSPVLIGALAVPWTQGVGISFLTTSFGVAAWHLGIALVDILLADVAGAMLATGGISGGVTAATTISLGLLPVFLGILAGIIFVALALYLAVPLVMAAVLRGGSPLTTGAKAGMEMALSALGVTGLTSARLGAAWAAQTKTANSGDNEDKSKEGARMAHLRAIAQRLRERSVAEALLHDEGVCIAVMALAEEGFQEGRFARAGHAEEKAMLGLALDIGFDADHRTVRAGV